MVVILSNNEFSDAVSGIIERDYFPSHERCDNSTDEKSLTEFHRTTTSATALQLHETLEEKKRAHLHKQSLIYTSNHASADNASIVTAELRNALFFPVSKTDTEVTEGPTTIVSSKLSAMMPPPRKRKPTPISLNRNNNDDCSLTTLNTGNITNISSNKLINSSATRFPTKATQSRSRVSTKRKNCYRNDDADHHWEGSTKNGEDGEDDVSYFTDLDSTTVDSYSIRLELRKAEKASRKKEKPHVPAPSSIGTEFVINDNIRSPLVYQLPRESPRELSASTIIQPRNQVTQSSPRRHRPNSSNTMPGRRPSHRSVKSLRSALKESYRTSQENIHSGVKF
jgi:hypothetical protein